MPRSERSAALLVLVAATLAACEQGPGSDIGPRLPPLPAASSKVVVLDDDGQGVVGARVTVDGIVATTGRNGRGDFLAEPRGRRLVAVDGADAAAVAGDQLGSVRFATTIVGPDLPYPIHLPTFEPASTVPTPLPLGVHGAPTTVTAPAGGSLTVAAGSTVASDDANATAVTLRVDDLQPQHVPGDLPAAASGALLTGRVFVVDPPEVTFAPAADLDLPDDLGLGGGATATLFGLDPVTGEWSALRQGLSATAGRVAVPAAVARGGWFVLGSEVPATTLSGRVRLADATAVSDVMVTVDGVHTTTDADGRFTATIPGELADGTPRSATLELFAGGSWLPARVGTTFAVTAGTPLDVGELTFDTSLGGNVRVQAIQRGRAAAFSTTRLSAVLQPVSLVTISDADGQAWFEDVPAEWFGFQEARPRDAGNVYYGQSVGFLERGRRWQDAFQFFDDRPWFLGSRSSRVLLSDSRGGGPLFEAALVAGEAPNTGFVGSANQTGTIFVDRAVDGRATATLRSERSGEVLVDALSIQRPNGDHLELPLERLLRAPLGAFDRHGLVAGTLTGADPAREHRLRATRRIELQEWWDDVVEGVPIASSLPIDVDPATTHGAFVAGLPPGGGGGHLAAAELTSAGGVATLEKLALLTDFAPPEAARTARDLALDLVADQEIRVADALLGAPAAIDAAQLTFDLALRQPSGLVVDVARDLRGNVAPDASDLVFTLPSLAGLADGHEWLALVRGAWPSGADTVSQAALVSLPRPVSPPGTVPAGAFAFAAFPDVAAPAAGATVPSAGFAVDFTLPAGARYGVIELRSETAGERLRWRAVVPTDLTRFDFVALPAEADTPLLPGRTYTLTVTACFVGGVLGISDDPYRDLTTFLQSIGIAELGASPNLAAPEAVRDTPAVQVTRRSFTITTS